MSCDAHVITRAPLSKIRAILQNPSACTEVYKGKHSFFKKSDVVARDEDTVYVDFITTVPVAFIHVDTPYRAALTEARNTDGCYIMELRQVGENKKIRNLYSVRYVAEIEIDGEKFCYIRFYNSQEIPAQAVPKSFMRAGNEDALKEVLSLLIVAAKK
jgi:hypothetical protein